LLINKKHYLNQIINSFFYGKNLLNLLLFHKKVVFL